MDSVVRITGSPISPTMAPTISSTSPSTTMSALRLPISLTVSLNSPARRRRLRVNSTHPLFRKSLIFSPNSLPKPLPTRIFPVTCHSKTTDHHLNHRDHEIRGHDHDHAHTHNHCHHRHPHHRHGGELKLTKSQQAFADFAKAIKWTDLADFLNEHLELCCFSTALFLAAAACPYLLPKASVKSLQHVLALVAFPLVGTPTEIRKFLVLTGYYRRFIEGFSKVAQPLTSLTHKGTPYVWTYAQEASRN